mmetsp:Transcript_2410/g.4289  ORF Transcript_2410/g.4289 Transcript_2410/m.4289 type:complete len:202 (-) Transcript_2410:466-1071(-)
MGWNEPRRCHRPKFQPCPSHDHPLRHHATSKSTQGIKLPQSTSLQKTRGGQRRHSKNGRNMETNHNEINHGPLPRKSSQTGQGDRNAKHPPIQPHGRRCQQILWRKNTTRERPKAIRANDGRIPRKHGSRTDALRELPREQEVAPGVRRLGRAEHHYEQRVRRSAGVAAPGGRSIRRHCRGGWDGQDTGQDSHGGFDDWGV